MKKKILIVSLFVLALFALTSCGRKTVKLDDYIEIVYSPAYDGYAKPTLVFDKEKFNEIIDYQTSENFYIKVLKNTPEYKEDKEYYDEQIEILKKLQGAPNLTGWFHIDFAEDYSKLSNGDKIKVSVSNAFNLEEVDLTLEEIAKGLGIKFSKTEIEYKVKGLEEVKKVPVDLEKLITVNFGKYNGYSTPNIAVNAEYISEIAISEIMENYIKDNPMLRNSVEYDNVHSWLDFSFAETYSNISNGDKIKVLITPDYSIEDKGITLEELENGMMLDFGGGEITYTVSGLEEATGVIDIFEGIEQYIEFEGANGYGSVSFHELKIPKDYSRVVEDVYFSYAGGDYANFDKIKAVYNNKSIGEINFDCEGNNLSKGDIIELTIRISGDKFEENGFIIPTRKINVEVPDLGEHLTSIDQLTPERIEALKTYVNQFRSPKQICELYYATYNPGYECDHINTSFIVPIIYKTGFLSSGYYIDKIYDVILKPDGSITSLESDYSYSSWSGYDTLDETKAALNTEKYTFTLIK